MKLLGLTFLVVFLAAPLAAQDTVVIRRPAREAHGPSERHAVAVYNADATMRILGQHTIGRNIVVDGDVAIVDGPLRIEGRVSGEVVAINADVEIVSGAEVDGDILVLGGHARVDDDARLQGTLEQHTDRVSVRFDGDRLEIVEHDERVRIEWRDRTERRFPRSHLTSRASLVVTSGGTYNRVEGLPLLVGPRITWSMREGDARLEGFGIFRTAASLDLQNRDVGYRAQSRLRLGRSRQLELSARVFDQVMPIEDWQLRDDEVGWASLLVHRDYRDYFLAKGVGAFGRARFGNALSLWADATQYTASSLDARDPWTLFRGSAAWRANPAIDEGRFTEYRAGFELGTPQRGHWDGGARLRGEWLHGIGDSVVPVVLPLTVRDPIPATGYRYDRAWADLRIYQSFPGGALSLRGLAAGTFGKDGPLPIQRRLSLGGPDPLPGYPFRRFNCNNGVSDASLPALCDRMVLFQAEYRTGFSVDVGDGGDDDPTWWGWHNWDSFDWDDIHIVLFSDAGSAWVGDVTPKRLDWDVGAGFEIGGFGAYVARAFVKDQPVRVVLRLHHRF